MSRLPVRLRLTVSFAAAMTVILGGAGFLLFHHLAGSLDRTIDQGLRARAADVGALVTQADTGLRDAPRTRSGLAGGFAQVLTRNGRILDQTRGLDREPLLDAGQIARAYASPLLIPRTEALDTTVRLLAVPVNAQGQALLVVVGAPLTARDQALASLRAELIVGGPIALLLASLIGYLLAAAALKPVERIRASADSISERHLSERLPVPPTRDEIARLGNTLNAMLARIEGGVERERRFVADASHELRTPLALLRAEVELALDLPRDADELRTALRSIGEEADRLSQLAEDLLLLARLDEGRLPLREERIELDDLLHHVAARYSRRAADLGRTIHIDAGGASAHGDSLRLEQAVGNLIENSLRHGAGTVTITASANRDRTELRVRDEGNGFPPGFAARAFERFSRADPGRAGTGAGLGLAIVAAIAEAHGGNARLQETKTARGAEVVLLLPANGVAPETTSSHDCGRTAGEIATEVAPGQPARNPQPHR